MLELSSMYLYYYSRYLTGFHLEGTTLWAGCRASKAKGICLKELWPDNSDVDIDPNITKVADKDAYTRRLSFYQRCFNINDIKYALINNGPLSVSFRMFESFEKSSKYGVVQLPASNENETDIHTITIVGYDDKLELITDDGETNKGYLKFANSWGANWGDKGFGYLPYAYFNNDNIVETVTTVPLTPYAYKNKYNIKYKNRTMNIRIGFSDGYTLTHRNIMFMDLYDDKDKLIGWVINSKENPYTVELIDFFIWPEYRYNGYGKLLLNEYLKHEKSKGITNVYGWFSKDDNETDGWYIVTKFFKDNGFECTQNRTVFPWATGQISIDI